MSGTEKYEQLKTSLFEIADKFRGKYIFAINGQKLDVIRNVIRELDLDDEYWRWLQTKREKGGEKVDEVLRRFKIKDEHNIEALQSLMAEKSLTKDDLILITSTIEVNEKVKFDIS